MAAYCGNDVQRRSISTRICKPKQFRFIGSSPLTSKHHSIFKDHKISNTALPTSLTRAHPIYNPSQLPINRDELQMDFQMLSMNGLLDNQNSLVPPSSKFRENKKSDVPSIGPGIEIEGDGANQKNLKLPSVMRQ